MALFASLPYLLSTATTFAFGFVSDRFTRKAPFCAVGLAVAGLGIMLAAYAPDPLLSAILITLGSAIWGIATPAYYAISQRIIPSAIVATGTGIDNGLANLGASAIPLVVGWLIAVTDSYFAGLMLLAFAGFLGALAMVVLALQRY